MPTAAQIRPRSAIVVLRPTSVTLPVLLLGSRVMPKMWHYFWFKPVDVRQFAILRISFGYLCAVYLVQLLPLVDAHFSGNSWLASVQLPKLLNFAF